MSKRTSKEVEQDYKRIKEFVDKTLMTSLEEVAKTLDMPLYNVMYSLSKHPRTKKRVLAQLKKNRKEIKGKKKAEEAKAKPNEKNSELVEQFRETAVVDAKIINEEWKDVLSNPYTVKIVLDGITIDKLHKFLNSEAFGAKRIMAIIAEDQKSRTKK